MTGVARRLGAFAALVQRRPVLSLLAATVLVSAVVVVFPGLDLVVSRAFHVPGEGFPAQHSAPLIALRKLGQGAAALAAVAVVVSLIVPAVFRRVSFLLPPRAALFLATTLILGPGLIVSALLKNHWGRARPHDVLEFGGSYDFSPAWEMVSYCRSNCSFVSGEASVAIWFMAFALIVPLAWRLRVALAAFAFALAVSVNRIAFGGHFLSDVLLAWLLTLTVIVVCYRVFYPRAYRVRAEQPVEVPSPLPGRRRKRPGVRA